MGLAFDTISSTRSTPFWQALAQNGELATQEMGFWLTRAGNVQGSNNVVPGGVFTLGGINSTFINGDIDFVDLVADPQPSFWLLPLTGRSFKLTQRVNAHLRPCRCHCSRSIYTNFCRPFCHRHWYDSDWWPNRRSDQDLECCTGIPGSRSRYAWFLDFPYVLLARKSASLLTCI